MKLNRLVEHNTYHFGKNVKQYDMAYKYAQELATIAIENSHQFNDSRVYDAARKILDAGLPIKNLALGAMHMAQILSYAKDGHQLVYFEAAVKPIGVSQLNGADWSQANYANCDKVFRDIYKKCKAARLEVIQDDMSLDYTKVRVLAVET